jgi:hypothetical protein
MKHLLALLAAALMVLGTVGCTPTATTGKKDKDKNGKAEAVVLEVEEITIIPGEETQSVKVKSGKADSAEAPEDSGVTATVKDGKVDVKADKKAKPGTHEVTVKGKDGKPAKLKVKVKAKEEE